MQIGYGQTGDIDSAYTLIPEIVLYSFLISLTVIYINVAFAFIINKFALKKWQPTSDTYRNMGGVFFLSILLYVVTTIILGTISYFFLPYYWGDILDYLGGAAVLSVLYIYRVIRYDRYTLLIQRS
jgi:hypothetical protein